MDQAERIITIYLEIEKVYNELTAERPLRRGGFPPALSDGEVLTMEIIGELEGKNGDRAIWQYFNRHWRAWFPALCAYKTFAKQCSNLCWMKQSILSRLFPARDDVYIIDGVPMPVCHRARASHSRMLDSVAAWGYCAAKDAYYYGLKGHVMINLAGYITTCPVTPAGVDEREALADCAGMIKGTLIGDKGYISQKWTDYMADNGVELQTPLRDNMPDKRPGWAIRQLLKVRKKVETVLSVLTGHFAFTKIKAHDIWHFTSKLYRKILAYNFYVMLKS